MAHRIAKFVHVAGFLLEPGDVPPPDIADQVTNPKAWTSEDSEQSVSQRFEPSGTGPQGEASDEEASTGSGAEKVSTDDEPAMPAEAPAVQDEEVVERPAGNASAETWREFIFAVTDEDEAKINAMSRSELIALADEIDAEAGDE